MTTEQRLMAEIWCRYMLVTCDEAADYIKVGHGFICVSNVGFLSNETCGECIGVRVFAFSNLTRWLPTIVVRWLISTPSHISCVLWRACKRGTWPILEQLCTGFLLFCIYNVLYLTSTVMVQSIRPLDLPTNLISLTTSLRVAFDTFHKPFKEWHVIWIRNYDFN